MKTNDSSGKLYPLHPWFHLQMNPSTIFLSTRLAANRYIQLHKSTLYRSIKHMSFTPGPIYERIVQKLTDGLNPTELTLRDQSHLHAHHAQSPNRPETHFDLHIVSTDFEGMPIVQRQRKVFEILSEEMSNDIHALSMTTKTPDEDGNKK